jgi:3-hydroxyacyl-CoA dehydrogenase
MGAGIAALLAAAGCRTFLLDIVPEKARTSAVPAERNAIALAALKALPKSKPPALMSQAALTRLVPGNIEDDLERAAGESDIVIEAVVERLDVKVSLFERLGRFAKKSAVLASNTSGIPVASIARGLPAEVRERVLGLHFFNPPRWMHLLEVIPSEFTAPEIVAEASDFCDVVLGKGIVPCRDTPNFIGNRIGIVEMLLTFEAAARGNFTIEEVDFLNGPLLGRPKTGSFRLGDMVGIDVLGHVVKNLESTLSSDPNAPNFDPLHPLMRVPPVVAKLIAEKRLGDKSGQGFYRKLKTPEGKSVIASLDLVTLEYRARLEPSFPEFAAFSGSDARPRIQKVLATPGRGGDFLRSVILPLMNYAAGLVGNICSSPQQIDEAMRWGYGWQLGPIELLDAAGPAWVIEQLKGLGITPSRALLDVAAAPGGKFYDYAADTVFVPGTGPTPVVRPRGAIFLSRLGPEHILAENPSARLLDIGDGVACLEFRSKANILDDGVVRLTGEASAILHDKGFRGLVVGNQADHFCRGANLFYIAGLIMQKNFAAVERAVKELQDAFMNLRHGPVPVVAAPLGQTLGGGTELCLHAHQVQAGADLFMGLVEMGVGVLPAGGGLKEIARRAAAWAAEVPGQDPYAFVRRGFEAVALAKVSGSAFEARENGFLTERDGITFHPKRVIADAKKKVIGLAEAGYVPPDRHQKFAVMGEAGGANMLLGLEQFVWGGYASEHDRLIGRKIVHVLSGGMAPAGTLKTAQDLLDLEREAFVALTAEAKTFERIRFMLENKKPLRN